MPAQTQRGEKPVEGSALALLGVIAVVALGIRLVTFSRGERELQPVLPYMEQMRPILDQLMGILATEHPDASPASPTALAVRVQLVEIRVKVGSVDPPAKAREVHMALLRLIESAEAEWEHYTDAAYERRYAAMGSLKDAMERLTGPTSHPNQSVIHAFLFGHK
jgi:hypothetical protein